MNPRASKVFVVSFIRKVIKDTTKEEFTMSKDIKELKETAEVARMMYRKGKFNIVVAKALINPYLKAVNEKAKELAKKYNQKPRKVNFYSYVR